jgi:hypothetical protein
MRVLVAAAVLSGATAVCAQSLDDEGRMYKHGEFIETGSGINAMPLTHTQKGRQYVTVLSGGLYWNIAREQRSVEGRG